MPKNLRDIAQSIENLSDADLVRNYEKASSEKVFPDDSNIIKLAEKVINDATKE